MQTPIPETPDERPPLPHPGPPLHHSDAVSPAVDIDEKMKERNYRIFPVTDHIIPCPNKRRVPPQHK